MRILLTGASGQVGRELFRSLHAYGELIPLARASSKLPPGCEARIVDFARPALLREHIREIRPQLIVNAAAYTAVDAAETHRDLAMSVNAAVPGVLAEEAKRLGALVVHYSTDYVFNGAGQRPWREEDSCDPINFYGFSKLAGEEAIRTSGAEHWILRTSWVYGAHGINFVKKMLHLALHQSEIPVVDDQIGSPTSARFLANVTSALVRQMAFDKDFAASHGGTYHAVCSGEASWFDFAQEIFRLLSDLRISTINPHFRPIHSTGYPSAAKRPLNSRLDTSKLTRGFGISAPDWRTELSVNLALIHAEHSRETTFRS